MTLQEQLEYYLSLPWTVVSEPQADDGPYYLVTVKELPGLIVTGTEDEISASLYEALVSHLMSFLVEGEYPPEPENKVVVSYSYNGSAFIASTGFSGVYASVEPNPRRVVNA